MENTLITAAEAFELSFPCRVDETIAELDTLIRKSAALGNTKIRVPYSYIRVNGYSAELKSKKVERRLIEAGYILVTQFEEKQFVDVWLEITWGIK